MSNAIGNHFRVTVFGQSHAPSIGCVIEGLPAGFVPDWDEVRAFMARRAPGGALSTSRREADLPEILSGLNERGETCGAPLAMRIVNGDARSADYDRLRDLPRPGHADYSASVRYCGANDIRGGGQFSGRLTAPLCFAGALAGQLLRREGVRVGAHILQIGDARDDAFDPVRPQLDGVRPGPLPTLGAPAAQAMREAIEAARARADSVGGIVECAAVGLKAGLGDPMFDGVENLLARALFGIPAVRGVEFGDGFAAARMFGSEHNDPWRVGPDGSVASPTNHHAGILGGITTGMPILLRAAFKPTPSIGQAQQTVSLSRNANEALTVSGRHDPCVVPRAVPCVEAVVSIVLWDLITSKSAVTGG